MPVPVLQQQLLQQRWQSTVSTSGRLVHALTLDAVNSDLIGAGHSKPSVVDGAKVVAQFEIALSNSSEAKLDKVLSTNPSVTRDCVMTLLRAYGSLRRMDAARQLFLRYINETPVVNACSAVFDTFLSLLAQQPSISKKEVNFVLQTMQTKFHLPRTVFTYLALVEIHLRMYHDCVAVWNRMREEKIEPTPAILRLLMHGAVLQEHADFRFVLEVTQWFIKTVEQPDTTILEKLLPIFLNHVDAGPEHAAWILFELELRCVLDKVSLTKLVDRASFIRLLLKCAKCGDAVTSSRILAMMERHQLPATADALALALWSNAAAMEVEKAIDTLEDMAQRGLLDGVDHTKRFVLEALNMPMSKHYLAIVAEALHTTEAVDRAYFRLEQRKREGLSVTVHSLDLIVLACAKIGDDDRAVETMEAYASLGVHPRTQSYNALLVLCGGRAKSRQHRTVFDSMIRNGVKPNYHTMRVLIRQAVTSDNVDEALEFLYKAPTFPGVRIDVEMILPILERAARVGDVDTVVELCNFALQCDIGIDVSILHTAAARIRELGIDASVIEALIPSHEKVRGKYGIGRTRGKPNPAHNANFNHNNSSSGGGNSSDAKR